MHEAMKAIPNSFFLLRASRFPWQDLLMILSGLVNHFWISNAKVNFSPQRAELKPNLENELTMGMQKNNADFLSKGKNSYFIKHSAGGFTCIISFNLHSNALREMPVLLLSPRCRCGNWVLTPSSKLSPRHHCRRQVPPESLSKEPHP